MVTRLIVAGFGQRGHGLNGHILDGDDLGGAALDFLLKVSLLITQKVGGRLDLQLGFHPCQHDGWIDRLGDVVHGAHLQTQDLVFHCCHGGDEDYRNMSGARIALELLCHLIPRQIRHHDVEQNQIRARLLHRCLQRALTADGNPRAVDVLQQAIDQRNVLRRIIDNEDDRAK